MSVIEKIIHPGGTTENQAVTVKSNCFFYAKVPYFSLKLTSKLNQELNRKSMVNILCYRSKTLANGEHPLVIRVCKDGKKKYIGLGISVHPDNWDFEKNKPKRNCPNKEAIQQLIIQKTNEFNNQIVEFKTTSRDFTATNTHLDIYFSDIDVSWLRKYETWLEDLSPASFLIPKGSTTASLEWACIGYNQLVTPIQVLTFYNAIANSGAMVQPQLYKDSVKVINSQIASETNLHFIREALTETVVKGLGKHAASDKVQVAGKSGTIHLRNEEYAVEFCGYFPAG